MFLYLIPPTTHSRPLCSDAKRAYRQHLMLTTIGFNFESPDIQRRVSNSCPKYNEVFFDLNCRHTHRRPQHSNGASIKPLLRVSDKRMVNDTVFPPSLSSVPFAITRQPSRTDGSSRGNSLFARPNLDQKSPKKKTLSQRKRPACVMLYSSPREEIRIYDLFQWSGK